MPHPGAGLLWPLRWKDNTGSLFCKLTKFSKLNCTSDIVIQHNSFDSFHFQATCDGLFSEILTSSHTFLCLVWKYKRNLVSTETTCTVYLLSLEECTHYFFTFIISPFGDTVGDKGQIGERLCSSWWNCTEEAVRVGNLVWNESWWPQMGTRMWLINVQLR